MHIISFSHQNPMQTMIIHGMGKTRKRKRKRKREQPQLPKLCQTYYELAPLQDIHPRARRRS
jgi:hypothetical protein